VAIIITLPVKAVFRRVLSNQRVRFSLYFSARVQGTQDLVSNEFCEVRSLPLAQILGCIASESHWLSMLHSAIIGLPLQPSQLVTTSQLIFADMLPPLARHRGGQSQREERRKGEMVASRKTEVILLGACRWLFENKADMLVDYRETKGTQTGI
jgi:hypothetical protein